MNLYGYVPSPEKLALAEKFMRESSGFTHGQLSAYIETLVAREETATSTWLRPPTDPHREVTHRMSDRIIQKHRKDGAIVLVTRSPLPTWRWKGK
jgi:hypothetical protein